MTRLHRRLAAVAVVGMLTAAGSAYLAENVVTANGAGEGSGKVTVLTTSQDGHVQPVTATSFQIGNP